MLIGAVMDTERILANNGTSPGSNGSNSGVGVGTPSNAPSNAGPPLPPHPPPIPSGSFNNSPANNSTGLTPRKKKSDRIVAPVNHASLLQESGYLSYQNNNQTNGNHHYSNDPGYVNGITNHGYTQENSVSNSSHELNRLNNTTSTVHVEDEQQHHTPNGFGPNASQPVVVQPSPGPGQGQQQPPPLPQRHHGPTAEVIEVQILPQDENWGESRSKLRAHTTDSAHANSSLVNSRLAGGGGLDDADETEVDFGGLNNPEDHNVEESSSPHSKAAEKWLGVDTDRGWAFSCRRHATNIVTSLLALTAFVSPIVMVALPSLEVLELRDHQLVCGVECDGMLVSLGFKLVILAVGSWALFFRRSRATLPRIHIFRAVIAVLILVFLTSFWLFYISHLVHEKDLVKYRGLVQFSLNLVDSLLFVHYLALILIEIRHRQPQYYVKVLRSPDGQSKGFAIGEMSVQRAASWILDKYYSEFPIYNPFLDRVLNGGRGQGFGRRGVKVYDIDGGGQSVVNDGNSTVVSVASRRNSMHADRFHEEHEYERKVRKRKARLIIAAEEAFTHIRRMNGANNSSEKSPMEPYEAAQAIFPTLSRPLQKYLRATRQQPNHNMESILQHLSTCLSFDLSPRAFLERYLVTTPVLQNQREHREIHNWSLVSERSLYRDIEDGTIFQLRQGDVSLLCQVQRLPHFNMSEEIIEPSSNSFVLRINSETSV